MDWSTEDLIALAESWRNNKSLLQVTFLSNYSSTTIVGRVELITTEPLPVVRIDAENASLICGLDGVVRVKYQERDDLPEYARDKAAKVLVLFYRDDSRCAFFELSGILDLTNLIPFQ
jgi:hypothetical protein